MKKNKKPPQWGHSKKPYLKGWWNGGPAWSKKNKLRRKIQIARSRAV